MIHGMLTVRVPAKINLHLEVLGRRPDGYHELRTLLQSIDWYDELEIEDRPGDTVELVVEPVGAAPAGADNLVAIAAARLAAAHGGRRGARIVLHKRIPAGAGLGGGSADAAAALVGLQTAWDLPGGVAELWSIAASIGSDVPFFLLGGLALGVGRGDEVIALDDLATLGVVVVDPEIVVATAEVYRRLTAPREWRRPGFAVYSVSDRLGSAPRWAELRNDLEPVVVGHWPQVAEALSALDRDEALRVGVTGSGSAVFGLYPDRVRAARAADRLAGRFRCHVGITLARTAARLRAGRSEEVTGS